jgi:hypothetical protein
MAEVVKHLLRKYEAQMKITVLEERKKERKKDLCTHTHIHTHTHREREREREGGRYL